MASSRLALTETDGLPTAWDGGGSPGWGLRNGDFLATDLLPLDSVCAGDRRPVVPQGLVCLGVVWRFC